LQSAAAGPVGLVEVAVGVEEVIDVAGGALTISPSFFVASATRLRSTSSRSTADTQEGSTSMARQITCS
jgi:hypothetical protein